MENISFAIFHVAGMEPQLKDIKIQFSVHTFKILKFRVL